MIIKSYLQTTWNFVSFYWEEKQNIYALDETSDNLNVFKKSGRQLSNITKDNLSQKSHYLVWKSQQHDNLFH